ncbi:hypothetical protein SLEP1_g5917 [Rubroshorea leprosula]|uniref:Uncharacterized protein n=1 Tax=Rubroshorea leprosula TaxID=152421 RepID=A0AAV5HZE6_9ROSI|nr:hypothetical protein SLEP1_g5917 [Rubroshorea leprosula]
MNSSPILQQISQDEIDGNNCSILQAVNDNNDNFLTVQVDDLEELEEISTSTAMEIEGRKMLGEDDIISGMPRKATYDEMTTYDVSYGFGGKFDSHFVQCGPFKEEFACTCGKFETNGKQVSQSTTHIRRRTCSTCGIKGHDSRICEKTKEKVIEDGNASQLPYAKE